MVMTVTSLEKGARLVQLTVEALKLIRTTGNEISEIAQGSNLLHRYDDVQLLCVIVDANGLPLKSPSLFLAKHSMQSRGVTGSTVRTYGECLVDWMRFLQAKNLSLEDVDEETLQIYRASLVHRTIDQFGRRATSTANLRVTVVTQFYLWGHSNGFPTALGRYLSSRTANDRSLTMRVIRRHPKVLGSDEISRLMLLARQPYKLFFQWGLATGMRRFEISGLCIGDLPRPESISHFEDGLASFQILRKGGKDMTVYVPVSLIEATNWYVLVERNNNSTEKHIFLSTRGTRVSLQSVSKEFRRCANEIGSTATLHHLRHTFAVNVLASLDKVVSTEHRVNAQKVVQVLLGHSSMQTTERYLEAMSITSPHVVEALEHLYGAGICR